MCAWRSASVSFPVSRHAAPAAQKLYRRPHCRRISPTLTSVLSSLLRAMSHVVDRVALLDKDAVSNPPEPRWCACATCTRTTADDFEGVEIRDPRNARRTKKAAAPAAVWANLDKLLATDVGEKKSPLRKIVRRFRLTGKRVNRRLAMMTVATEAVEGIAAIAHRFQGLDADGAGRGSVRAARRSCPCVNAAPPPRAPRAPCSLCTEARPAGRLPDWAPAAVLPCAHAHGERGLRGGVVQGATD